MEKTNKIYETLKKEGFSDIEISEIMERESNHRELLEELLIESRKSVNLRKTLTNLHKLYARYNYEIYENFMAVHVNAIAISAKKAEISLLRIDLPDNIKEIMENILDEYLLLKQLS